MEDAVARTKQLFRDAQKRRLTAYSQYPLPVEKWPARAMRDLLDVQNNRRAAVDNYTARRRARGTRPATLVRARSEALTALLEEVRLWDELCEVVEATCNVGHEARAPRLAWIQAWYDETAALNRYCIEQDECRLPPTAGELAARLPLGSAVG